MSDDIRNHLSGQLAEVLLRTDVPADASTVESTGADTVSGECSLSPMCRESEEMGSLEVVSVVENTTIWVRPCAPDLPRWPSLLAWRCDLRVAAAAARCCMIRSSSSPSSVPTGTWNKYQHQ
jgi:hypothetical protein